MKRYILVFVLFPALVVAQSAQKLEYPSLGVSIEIPSGLTAQEGDEVILLSSYSLPQTLFVLSMHEYSSIDELKEAASEPYTEDNGTRLSLKGELRDIGSDAVGGTFSGTAAGAPAEAFIIGKLNPHGNGVSIIAVSTNNATSLQVLEEYAVKINAGIRFSEADDPTLTEYRNRITNARLQYSSSYSSSGGIGGSSNYSETYDICGAGYFIYYGSSSISMGSNSTNVYGGSNSSSQGNGSWNVELNSSGEPVLVLSYNNGNEERYTLYYERGYLQMNGTKHTIGRGSEYGPACN